MEIWEHIEGIAEQIASKRTGFSRAYDLYALDKKIKLCVRHELPEGATLIKKFSQFEIDNGLLGIDWTRLTIKIETLIKQGIL